MLIRIHLTVAVLTLFAATVASGATMKDLMYQGASGNDMALFHGDKHVNRGIKCDECHNKDVFPEKKFGAAKITMKSIAAGKHCGVCHNGKRAFGITGKCNLCHPIKSGDMVVYD